MSAVAASPGLQTLDTEAVVIGAGVVGLAIARALAMSGVETVVLERAGCIGSEISSRNSEVIHAGLYYPPKSLKAKLCVRGKELLYAYLEQRSLPHSRCGKLIVAASPSDKIKLEQIAARAALAGVEDLQWLTSEAIGDLEPELRASMGLLSPSTGIVDSHQFMVSLLGEFEASGGVVAYNAPVTGGKLSPRGLHEVLVAGAEPATVRCKILVNATGLHARETLLLLSQNAPELAIPQQWFAKGHYYSYSGHAPFNRLVYPVPEPGGLGVHATLDLAGQSRFGPDVCWQGAIDYSFDDRRRPAFIKAIRRYYPGLDSQRLQPGYTGIRPKIAGPEALDPDFLILTEAVHGLRGFCSLHGIESPGLTAALAIAEVVAEM